MRLTRYYLPTLKETPAEAQIVSHRLMLRAGMIRQSSAGIYSWLPLGLRVLRNIERIVREEQDRAGAIELLMPTLQPAELWRESGRYDAYGPEMLRIVDRHERDLLYGPTNEELITEIVRGTLKSYRQLPKLLYHIQWKFRDEIRPRFGVMRGREFLMKDAYSFDLDRAGAVRAYHRMFVAYLRTFERLGLKAIPMQADTGPIGGDLSHEFVILAPTGESEIAYHADFARMTLADQAIDDGDLATLVDAWTSRYAATDEKRDPAVERDLGADLVTGRGIEVGHIFYFGTKYSAPLGAQVAGPDGEPVTLEMGSYGIGVSRLAGAIIEASHDDAGIVWPAAVAPFAIGLIDLKSGDPLTGALCEEIYAAAARAGIEVLWDDRNERAGVKFSDMDLIGLPMQIIVGPKGAAAGQVEIKNRRTGAREEIPLAAALARLSG
jgi:prolyl-tRNA synthetase